jgi:hypothetical protein
MPIKVQGPDGSVNEFPDDMSEADISAVMAKTYGGETATTAPEAPAPDLTAGRAAGLVARGAYPVAAGALAGGALGSFAGPPGIAAGALVGGTAVPLGDALASVYNLGATHFGGREIKLPSEAIKALLTQAGLPVPGNAKEELIDTGGAMLAGGLTAPAAVTDDAARFIAGNIDKAKKIPQAVSSLAQLAPKEIPKTAAQTKALADAAYKIADNSGVRVSPEAFDSFVSGIPSKLAGYSTTTPSLLKQTTDLIDDLRNTAKMEEPMRFSELDNMRQNIAAGLRSAKGSNRKFFRQIRDEFDDFIGKLDESHLDVGEAADLDSVRSALTTARAAWGTQAKMGGISKIMSVAARQKYPDRYIEQQFTRISKNDKLFGSYTKDEQELITKVANGGFQDVLGKWFAPSGDRVGAVKTIFNAGAGAAATGNPLGGVILPAAGMIAKKSAERARLSNVQKLQDTISLGHKPMGLVSRWRSARAIRRAGIPE